MIISIVTKENGINKVGIRRKVFFDGKEINGTIFCNFTKKGLGQLDATGDYEEGTLQELKESYEIPVV